MPIADETVGPHTGQPPLPAPSPEHDRALPAVAADVLAELQGRYTKFRSRNRSYIRLLSFLAFVSLFMAVLFLQRSANTSYQASGGWREAACSMACPPQQPEAAGC